MNTDSPGRRVFAIAKMDATGVHLYGRGVYEGDFPHPYIDPLTATDVREIRQRSGAPAPTGEELAANLDLINNVFRRNPRIRLDNGQTVWGCECWWGPEEELERVADGRPIFDANIEADRKTFGKEPRNTHEDQDPVGPAF